MIHLDKKDSYPTAGIVLCALMLMGCGGGGATLYESADVAVSTEVSADVDDGGTDDAAEDLSAVESAESSDDGLIYVYICGEVETPGVYALPEGSRICDAVDAAGGMTDDAADTYLNLAEVLSDGEKIEVPDKTKAEELEAAQIEEALEAAKAESSLVNINTATEEELMTLSGIGESKAAAIVAYREENGYFDSIEGIMEISGIKEGVFNKIKDQITV